MRAHDGRDVGAPRDEEGRWVDNVRMILPPRRVATMIRFTHPNGDIVFGPYTSRAQALMALVDARLPRAYAADDAYMVVVHENDGRASLNELNLGVHQ